MNKKVFIKTKKILTRQGKKLFSAGMANKKTILIGTGAMLSIIIIMMAIGILAAHLKIEKLFSAEIPNSENKSNHKMISMWSNRDDGRNENITTPQDAFKNGEIAIVVSDLDAAKNNIQNVAIQNGGTVYDSQISYTSRNTRNGAITVQIPVVNFEKTFADLKKIGSQIVQESSRQIPVKNPIVYPQPLIAEPSESTETLEKNTATEVVSTSTAAPIYPQTGQDKGYIKVVFVEYTQDNDIAAINKTNIGNILGVGYRGQNMRENIWVVLAVKSIVLIVLIVLIVIIARRIVINLQKYKNSKPVVKQIIKSRKRIVKVATRKRK